MSTVTTTAPASASFTISAVDFEQVLKTVYTEEQAEVLRFWFFSARDRLWSLSRLAEATGISPTSLTRVFRGIYPTNPAEIIAKLARARETFHESSENPKFIETSLSKRLFAIFDKTRALRNVSILWGRMGIGKTVCIAEYQRRNNHGRTQVVRFPSGSTFSYFVTHIARGCGISTSSQSAFEQRGKIIQILSAGQRLLIIDELHQAFLTTRADTAVKCCEFLREVSDTARCGLSLIGTELLETSFFRGPHKDALRQLVDRGTVQIPLPPKATQADVKKFLAAYGLALPTPAEPDASAILGDIIKSAGLRKLTLHLRDGKAFANKREEPFTWEHFVAAFEAIQSLSKP
jgi:DNA transposition AAA+ family ATPase